MLNSIKAIYENGIIKPLEKINIKGKREAIVIFLDWVGIRKNKFSKAAGSWKDIDTEKLKKEIYTARRLSTARRKVNL